MTNYTAELETVLAKIEKMDAEERYKVQPTLAAVVEKMAEVGDEVPVEVRNVLDELTAEAVEAQFDNLPV